MIWPLSSPRRRSPVLQSLGFGCRDPRAFLKRGYDTILYYTILYSTLLYCTILYYTMLYYAILYYTILCYTMLYYTILCYAMMGDGQHLSSCKESCKPGCGYPERMSPGHKILSLSVLYGWLSKLQPLFASPKYWVPYCTKRSEGDHNFDKHPLWQMIYG